MAEEETLLRSVFRPPLLLDLPLLETRASERRTRAWREVAAAIGLSVVECKLEKEDAGLRKRRREEDEEQPNVDTHSCTRTLDEDELFLLSFVPALKRLTPQRRANAKMRIQQIMFDAEFKEI